MAAVLALAVMPEHAAAHRGNAAAICCRCTGRGDDFLAQ